MTMPASAAAARQAANATMQRQSEQLSRLVQRPDIYKPETRDQETDQCSCVSYLGDRQQCCGGSRELYTILQSFARNRPAKMVGRYEELTREYERVSGSKCSENARISTLVAAALQDGGPRWQSFVPFVAQCSCGSELEPQSMVAFTSCFSATMLRPLCIQRVLGYSSLALVLDFRATETKLCAFKDPNASPEEWIRDFLDALTGYQFLAIMLCASWSYRGQRLHVQRRLLSPDAFLLNLFSVHVQQLMCGLPLMPPSSGEVCGEALPTFTLPLHIRITSGSSSAMEARTASRRVASVPPCDLPALPGLPVFLHAPGRQTELKPREIQRRKPLDKKSTAVLYKLAAARLALQRQQNATRAREDGSRFRRASLGPAGTSLYRRSQSRYLETAAPATGQLRFMAVTKESLAQLYELYDRRYIDWGSLHTDRLLDAVRLSGTCKPPAEDDQGSPRGQRCWQASSQDSREFPQECTRSFGIPYADSKHVQVLRTGAAGLHPWLDAHSYRFAAYLANQPQPRTMREVLRATCILGLVRCRRQVNVDGNLGLRPLNGFLLRVGCGSHRCRFTAADDLAPARLSTHALPAITAPPGAAASGMDSARCGELALRSTQTAAARTAAVLRVTFARIPQFHLEDVFMVLTLPFGVS
ncbi:dcl1 [Symbiodinium sp. KB8]|nr:dcl1 [Symbiodinium sp. KB8]